MVGPPVAQDCAEKHFMQLKGHIFLYDRKTSDELGITRCENFTQGTACRMKMLTLRIENSVNM